MARPLRDSEYIFGMHDPGGEEIMLQAGKPGWVLVTERLGSNPADGSGRDYRQWSDRGLGVVARLNNGYEPEGTIPVSERYVEFARRCGNFVKASQGCHIWIIGNEMNFVVERPTLQGRSVQPAMVLEELDGDQDAPHSPREHPDRFSAIREQEEARGLSRSMTGFRSVGEGREVITPQRYATCYRLCREVIKSQPGHADDQVLVGAVAPWNNQTTYDGNANGDWVKYFQDILLLLGPNGCDGFTLHTYTHGYDPNLIYSKDKMNPPFEDRHYHFFAYRDFMNAVPANMRHLPCYITEADQDVEWRNSNAGWVRNAFGEINWWNQQPGHQQIRALILYRWPRNYDKWGIEGKQGVIDDFRQAMVHDYKWRTQPKPVPQPEPKPPYRVEWLEGGGLQRATGGQVLTTRFQLRNAGSKTWRSKGTNLVRLGYHWEGGDGQALTLPPDQDFRTPLPKDVAAGETVVLENVRAAVPNVPGALKLRWDLVEEGITWFKDQGSAERIETVTVVLPAPPDEQFFEQTGKWVRGPFLAWYRQHGLDVAGYPITEKFRDSATGLDTQYFQRVVMEEYEAGKIRLRLAGAELKQALQRILETEAEINRLRAQIADLEQRLRQAGGGAPLPPRIPMPDITDITSQLPRDDAGFARRTQSAIRYLVINHTGGPADLEIARVAEFHRQRGYPGIAYHYFVDQEGRLWQVNPWTDVVSDRGYLGEGLNIAFAGKFDQAIPNPAQLDAAARLCAWLLQELSLPPEAIKGVSEFVAHGSPGSQWLGGRAYKRMLLDRVAAVQPEPVAGPVQPPDDGLAQLRAQLAALQAQLADRDRQLAQLRDQLAGKDRRIGDLETQAGQVGQQLADRQAEIDRLRDLLAQAAPAPAEPSRLARPAMHDVVDELPKHATERYASRSLSKITHLCIHHSAVAGTVPVETVARYHVESRNWPGIGYHFYVKPDGTIYQTNRIETVSWQVANNNGYTIGVCVSGNFINTVPTDPQMDAAARLCAWLMQELDIPDAHVMGHKEYPDNDTTCPGPQWLGGRRWKETLLSQIRALREGGGTTRSKTIGHYLLFWQRPDSWAQQDWLAAQNYVGRFRPTAGFSVDDARAAEYVTIVGGVAGVSYEAEQLLRAAGCQVERLAGVDFADTKRMLDELAESGRRFLHLAG